MNLTFENPVYLWYLASIPLLVLTHFLSLRMAKRKAMRFANFQTLKRIAGERLVTKNVSVLIFRVLTVALLVLAASGVRMWYKAPQSDNNYVIGLDVSSSMSAKDFSPDRLETAKSYAKEFVDTLNERTKAGVVTFAGVTMIEQTLTDDKAAVKSSIDRVQLTQTGGTDMPGALITATNMLLSDSDGGKVFILFTDGSSTLGNFIDGSLDQATEYAVEHKVVVNGVGIGTESAPIGYLPEYYNISSVFGLDNLRLITNRTSGVTIPASEEQDLEAAYVDLLKRSDESLVDVRLDLMFLVAGLLLLFIEWGLINSRYRRVA
ncbi:VWA domain-containing protein [Candidatus Woesearchaeota archaeon]|nr:VWA domain-containing protein [Candidatus Woesearchaeota archaeon]